MMPVNYDRGWENWGDMIDFSPAPFHRRRLIMNYAKRITFRSVLDVGCGNGTLLREIGRQVPVNLTGVDLSEYIVDRNKESFPGIQFYTMDISGNALKEKFDLVICSEVLEHIEDANNALQNLRKMCGRYLIITVPTGPIFPIDKEMGHIRHYKPHELVASLRQHGFKILSIDRSGFPFHTLYKCLINTRPRSSLERFAAGSYGWVEKTISDFLRGLFYLNSSKRGWQLHCLAELEGQ